MGGEYGKSIAGARLNFGIVNFGRAVVFAPPVETGWHFDNAGTIAGTGNAADIAVADMDGDGDLDAVVATGGAVVLTNDGTGAFTAGASLYANSISVALADLDGDGDMDAVFSSPHNPGTIWLNDGMGNLTQGALLIEEDSGYSVEVGDFDGDGDVDILSVGDSHTRLFSNDGTGAFIQGWEAPISGARHAVVADFDGDGDLDFVTSHSSNSKLIYVNDGSGSFVSQIAFADAEDMTNLFDAGAAGDVDGDGDIDIATRVRNGSGDRIFLNDGSGSFTDSGQRLAQGPGRLELADFDADGDLDLISAAWAAYPTVVLENSGNGVFVEVQRFAGATFGTGVASGDFDGDGDIDVLVGSLAQGESHVPPVTLLRNEPGDPSTVDLTRPVPAFSAQGMSLVLPASLFAALPDATVFTADIYGNPLPEWLNFDPATLTLSFDGGAADPGTLLLQVTVTAQAPGGGSIAVDVPLIILDGVEIAGGGPLDDVLSGAFFGDFLDGQGGNDTLSGRNGGDLIEGGDGDDLIFGGNGDDVLLGENGNDTIRGGNGFNLMAGEAGDDMIYGGRDLDRLAGGAGNDLVVGGQGDDLLTGDDGADLLRGGAGYDLLWGDAGNDILNGGEGDDQLVGGTGNDIIRGGAGDDLCFGETGDDVFVFAAGCGNDVIIDFATGEDRLRFAAGLTLESMADFDFDFDMVADSTVLALSDGGSILLYGISGLSDPGVLFA